MEVSGDHSAGRRWGHTLGRLAPYLLILFLYVATSPFHNGLNNPNEMVRVYMTRAMVKHGQVNIDPVLREWGGVDDKAKREGKLYSSKAPLQSLVGVPAYWLFEAFTGEPDRTPKRVVTHWVRVFGAAIYGFIIAGILLAWTRRRAGELGLPVALGTSLGLVFALGTMLYPYAITFTGHILAALFAGGCYLATLEMARAEQGSRRWRLLAIAAGFCGGASPFAEYPSALVAGPALIAAFVITRGLKNKAATIGWYALGGLPPFILGLWAHHALWGSPVATGYSFLENKAYVEVHGSGFFGVGGPKLAAFGGSLFSPGTGLFFYSPILALGLITLLMRVFKKSDSAGLPRSAAISGLVGVVLSVLFISGHTGWRGGWTVGPRYIIALAPLLGVWVIEAARHRYLAPFIAPLGAISILVTGTAAALYPHLSDVYTNPIITFLWPSYLRGEATYGLAHMAGMSGTAANLVHLVPLFVALIVVAWVSPFGSGAKTRAVNLTCTILGCTLFFAGIAFIPEHDTGAALRENERLWGFWEPARPKPKQAGLMFRARERWQTIRVEAQLKTGEKLGRKVPCRRNGQQCTYGGMPWQHFGPDFLPFNGKHEPVLFLHPIAGWVVRARVPVPQRAQRALLTFGFTDASADSDNREPIHLVIKQGERIILDQNLLPKRGLQTYPLALQPNSRAPLILEMDAKKDGARVMGWDLDILEAPGGDV